MAVAGLDFDESWNMASEAIAQQDRRSLILLFCTFAFCYAFFYQGGGWNQNSHFDTIRALVERRTTEITAYARNTGDVGKVDGRIYSNKPPGLAFLGAPLYFAAYHLERALGLDPAAFRTATFNAQLLTFWTSGVPALVLLLLLFQHFRRAGATSLEGTWLAAAFGIGSLALPYAGVMMNHLLDACLLFAVWHLITRPWVSASIALLAGFLSGLAIMTESLAAPAASLFLLYLAIRNRRAASLFLLGAAPMAAGLLGYNYFCFGTAFLTNATLPSDLFQTEGRLFGMLGWPEPIRLYWLTFQPFRGLFICCPVLLVPLLSMRYASPFSSRRTSAAVLEKVIPLAIVAYHLLFNLSFNGWTGGWCVGPRYLIPALPFLFSFALTGFRRFRFLTILLGAVSALFMVGVSAVLVMIPAPNNGPALPVNPVFFCLRELAAGHLSISTQSILDYVPVPGRQWASYNLGELLGLHGLASLLPILLVLLAFALLARRLKI
jgi:hypothetical protein